MPFGKGMDQIVGQFYYWLSFIINFAAPFILLLIMNSFIIHTVRNRSNFRRGLKSIKGQTDGHISKIKNSERQIFVILISVTFSFLMLMTPTYVLTLYVTFVDYGDTPKSFAEFHLFFNVGHKTYYTNYAINFFLYVLSGQKFRTDLKRLFVGKKEFPSDNSASTRTNSINIILEESQ